MLCKGVIQENNTERPCWLPAQPGSLFELCRRCHFHRITDVLDELRRKYESGVLHPPHEMYLNDSTFLHELLHPAREQALLHLLAILKEQNKIQFHHVVRKLKAHSVFPILLTKRIQTHQPGPRCSLYRCFLRDKYLYTAQTLCWNCWSCIAWAVKQEDPYLLNLYTQTFGLNFSRLTHAMYTAIGPRVFLDLCVSLHLLGKDHHIRILLDHFLHMFPLDEIKSFAVALLQQPVFLTYWASHQESEFLPLPFRDPPVYQEIRRLIKDSIKQKTDTYKEELVIKTWHPSRLFPWCLDLCELADFGISSADHSVGRYGF